MAVILNGRDPFNQNSNRSDREKRTTSKGGPVFSKIFRLDRTDPLSFGPKFPEILVEWIAPNVSRDETKCKLNVKLVDSGDIRPILGRKACLGMNIIRYTDNDALNKPQTGSFPIYAVKVNGDKFLTREHLCNQFPEVFSEGVGKLEGK